MGIIALMGRAKSGKDTIGGLIKEADPERVLRMAFADKLKTVCMDVYGLSWDDVYTETGKDREMALPCLGYGVDRWTPRMILQHVASALRQVDNDVFVNFTMRLAAARMHALPESTVVITDCRFRVEADAVWRAGGQVWRIRRPLTDGQPQGIAGHASEVEMDSIPEELFQRVIVNDSTLDDLRARVLAALPV